MKIKTKKKQVQRFKFSVQVIREKLQVSKEPPIDWTKQKKYSNKFNWTPTTELINADYKSKENEHLEELKIPIHVHDNKFLIMSQFILPEKVPEEIQELEVTYQKLTLTPKELKSYQDPQYHLRILKENIKKEKVISKDVQTVQFRFKNQEYLELDQEFVDLVLTDQLMDQIKIRVRENLLEVVLDVKSWAQYLTCPPRELPPLLYKYLSKLTAGFYLESGILNYGLLLKSPTGSSGFRAIEPSNYNSIPGTEYLCTIAQISNVISKSFLLEREIKTYNQDQFKEISFIGHTETYYLSLNDHYVYHQFTLPSKNFHTKNMIISSINNSIPAILSAISNKIIDLNQLNQKVIILTHNPNYWLESYYLIEAKYQNFQMNIIKKISDFDKASSLIYIVDIRKTISAKHNQEILNHINKFYKGAYLIWDKVSQLNSWESSYSFLNDFTSCYLENPLKPISDQTLFNLDQKDIIISSNTYRINFCRTYEDLGIKINYTKWSEFEFDINKSILKKEDQIEEIETDEYCPVCFGELYLVRLECGHTLCPICLEKLSRESENKKKSSVLARYGYEDHSVKCPSCRGKVDPDIKKEVFAIKPKLDPKETEFRLMIEKNLKENFQKIAIHLYSLQGEIDKVLLLNRLPQGSTRNVDPDSQVNPSPLLPLNNFISECIETLEKNISLLTKYAKEFDNPIEIISEYINKPLKNPEKLKDIKLILSSEQKIPDSILGYIKPLGHTYQGYLEVELIK